MKSLLRIVLVLVVLLVVGGLAVFVFVDSLIKTAVEKGATYATGVETKLDSVDAGLLSGELDLDDLSIANPPGFAAEPFVHLGAVHAQWDNRSLLTDAIHVDEVVVDGVQVRLERTQKGGNWSVILDNLEKLSSKDKAPPPDEAAKQKHLSVDHIEVRDIRASLHLVGVPIAGGPFEVTVPRVVIDDFRTDGSTSEVLGKLTRAIVDAILDATLKGGQNIFPQEVLADLGRGLDDLRGQIEERADELLKGVDEGLKKTAEDVLEGVFKKKK